MAKIQTKIKFGKENLESLIDEIVKDKIYVVTNKLKNKEFAHYNKNYSSTNTDKKVDERK